MFVAISTTYVMFIIIGLTIRPVIIDVPVIVMPVRMIEACGMTLESASGARFVAENG